MTTKSVHNETMIYFNRLKRTKWRGRRSLIVVFLILAISYADSAVVNSNECGRILDGVWRVVGGVAASSQEYGVGDTSFFNSANNKSLSSPRQQPNNSQLCKRSTNSCCASSLLHPLLHSTPDHHLGNGHKSSLLLFSTFNNTFKFNTFKAQINTHLSNVGNINVSGSGSSSTSTAEELWKASIEGLRVLRDVGSVYWDTRELYAKGVLSNECLGRVVGNWVCYGCGGGSTVTMETVKPCKSLCHNTVVGCLKSPLAEYVEGPWKHAVNSVRTAVRLVMTMMMGGNANSDMKQQQQLQSLINDLNDWREPISWWLDEYKSSRACEGLPSTDCWNGEAVGKYEFPPVSWRGGYNPEFNTNDQYVNVNVTVELDGVRERLGVLKNKLERFWPTTATTANHYSNSNALPPHALALSSMEDYRRRSKSFTAPSTHHHYDNNDDDELGSGGFGDDVDDDEDVEYEGGSGFSHVPTDDEDLLRGEDELGSGSRHGDHEDHEEDEIINRNNNDKSGRPPVSLSCGGRLFNSFYFHVFVGMVMLLLV